MSGNDGRKGRTGAGRAGDGAATGREARLAAALRANLARRKAQARARKPAEAGDGAEDDRAGDDGRDRND